MTDLGLMRYFFGIQVQQTKGEIFICQEKYIEDLLTNFHMEACKLVSTPISVNVKLQQNDGAKMADAKTYRSLIGSLIYLTNTRPDIVHSVSLISRFMDKPIKLHYEATKRILCHLQGTKKIGIVYNKESDNSLVGFTGSDWADHLMIEKVHLVTFFA